MTMTLGVQYDRWKSGQHVGEARPRIKGYVRRGHLERHYRNLPDDEVYAYVPGTKGPNAVWYGQWIPDEDYVELPNILSAKGDGDFEQNGVENAVIVVDNIVMKETSGVAGLFHTIKRGYLAPLRGYAGFNQIAVANRNEWHDTFKDQATQIMLLAGYGEAWFPLWLGLIDDADMTSRPDRITITARNMGVFLTDQHTFMDAKHLWVRDPITFADRQQADDLDNAIAGAEASSHDAGHPPRLAIDRDDDLDNTAWISGKNNHPEAMEWIEFLIPSGRYEDFELYPAYEGMRMFVSVYATAQTNQPGEIATGLPGTTDGEDLDVGWVNEGLGHVPGTDIPYTHHVGQVKEKPDRYRIRKGGGGYIVGDNSRVRLWFDNLHRAPDQREYTYRAGVRNARVFKRRRQKEAMKNHWILVDDVSDIVKVVLQWAGFRNQFEVESVGVRLKDKLVFDRQTFLIDIIRRVAEMVSYIFYVKPPELFDEDDLSAENTTNFSPGVAVFRQNNAMKSKALQPYIDRNGIRHNDRYAVRDSDLLTGIQAKFSNAPLAGSIRVRGRNVNKSVAIARAGEMTAQQQIGSGDYDKANVHALGADRTKRFQYSYRPVWGRNANSRFAGLRRPVVHYDEQIDSVYEAKVACLFIAFREALESAQATIEFPAWPPINLDHQVVVYDEGTGLSTRIWVAARSWEFQAGEQPRFAMNVGGSLLDTDDIKETRVELQKVLNNHGFDPGVIARGPWTEDHFF